MALDRQIDFTGGLNTRIPAHKLPDNMVQAALNTDFTHGDVRPDTGIGGDGGGKQFYYEKGDSWVGTDIADPYIILVVDAGVTTIEANPTTNLGNPLTISETGIYQIGMTDTVTASSNILTTVGGAHGLVVNDTIVLAGGDVPLPLVAGTVYFIKTVPDVDEMTLCLTEGSTVITLVDAGSGTITLTSVTSVTVNDTELNLGSVTSFVEYNDDLYMGRETFSITATTLAINTGLITLTATDVAKVIVSDGVIGAGIPLGAKIESIDYGSNIVTIDKTITIAGSSVTMTIKTSPARIIDGILSKIFPIELSKPEPHSIVVSQLSGTNTTRFEGHSIKWVTDNFPIPLQWGIARFDEPTGAEGGISELTSIADSLAYINSDSTHTSVPAMVKFQINKQDANSLFYGKFALYRVGGTSSVIKKVQDILLTSQSDGSPMSALVARSSSTSNIDITVSGLLSGTEWKVKWYGYGGTGARRDYHSGGIGSITIGGTNNNYTTGVPTLTIAGGSGKTATATAVLTGNSIKNVIITDKGSGYSSPPAITITTADTTIGEISSLSDTTPTPSGAWEASNTETGVIQTSTSGSGTGAIFTTVTDGSGNPTVTVTTIGTGYAVNDTIVLTDAGSTSYTATITVSAITTTGNATATAVIESRSYTGESSWLSTTALMSIYGNSASHAVDLHFMVKFTSDDISPITGVAYSVDTREYLFASSNLVADVVLGDNASASHDGCGSIIDFTPPRALIEIEPVDIPTDVPYNLKYLTEFNNFFMGSVDTRLHISNYAKPNNYAIDGYLDFDGQITGIVSRGGEAVVFTEHSVYRVYGNAHNEMRKVQVPTIHGIPVGGHKTIAKIKDSIIYVSHTGICLFDGRNVTVLTDNLIQNFAKPSENTLNNVSGVIDDTYYLLSSGNDGWKVDLKQSPKICKSSGRASNFHYRAVNNKLFTEAGYIGGGTENKYSFETKDFTGGNITAEKAYYTVYVTGTDFSGTVNIKCDGSLTDTFTFGTPSTEFNRALSLSSATVANRASIEFVDCSGQITSVAIKYDILSEQQKKRFNFVTISYTGTPTVTVKVDSVQKIASTVLTNPGVGNTGTSILYFPAMTEGHIPHIIADETETSRVSGSVFDAVVI